MDGAIRKIVVGFLFVSTSACAREGFAERPDIVVILADDLGYGDLSVQGAADLRTPNVDRLFAEGMRMDRFYANCPVCSPTRASLLTGKYPELAGVPGVIRTHRNDSWGFLAPNVALLPERLRAAGYDTAIVGKWHLGLDSPNTPLERSFDHFAGFLGDMMDDYFTHRRHGINYMRRGAEEVDPEGHATDIFTDWAVEYIESRATNPRPFFLYLAYNAPHTPIQPPDDWLERVTKREREISPRRAKLVALIEHMDRGIGRVVEALKARGNVENTLIVFTSDNGGQLDVGARNGPLRGTKGEVYEGGIRVPACAVWPGRIARGSRSEVAALTMDLFPTVCEAAGTGAGDGLDGVSLLPCLLGDAERLPPRDLFWTRREGGQRYMGLSIWAVRRGPWKLLKNAPSGPFELYNLETDPIEKVDLASDNPQVFRELAAEFRKHVQRGGAVPWQRPSEE